MRKYETLIFDLDDTLIDNRESIRYAFSIMIHHLRLEYSDELFEKWYDFDSSYWHEWETGNIIIPDTIKMLEDKITYLRANRFILFFNELELDFATAVLLNDLYCSMLGVNIVGIEGARELLEEVHSYTAIFVATNGPKQAATDKVKKAKIDFYISSIISSEEVGFSKPSKEFFEFLFHVLPNKDKSKMLFIGDSLTTDILGGMNNGIDTCYFNPNHLPIPEKYSPTMTVHKLLQLKKKVNF